MIFDNLIIGAKSQTIHTVSTIGIILDTLDGWYEKTLDRYPSTVWDHVMIELMYTIPLCHSYSVIGTVQNRGGVSYYLV